MPQASGNSDSMSIAAVEISVVPRSGGYNSN